MRGLLVATFALSLIGSPAWSAPEPAMSTETGKIVTRLNRTLTIINQEEKAPRKFEIPVEAKVILDGQPARIDRLQTGDYVVLSFSIDKKLISVDAKSGMLKIDSAAFDFGQ